MTRSVTLVWCAVMGDALAMTKRQLQLERKEPRIVLVSKILISSAAIAQAICKIVELFNLHGC